MWMNLRLCMALLFALIVTLGALPPQVAQASSEVNFAKTSTLVRGAAQYGVVDACANKVYVPVKDGDGNLRITGMSLVSNDLANLPQAGNQHVAGAIQDVAIARLRGCNYFVTAVRTDNLTLKLIAWFSGSDGFQRLGDTGNSNMAVTEVDLTSMSVTYAGFPTDGDVGYVIAAVRHASGVFGLTSYWVDGGSFQHQDVVLGEQATKVAVTSLPPVTPDDGAGRAIIAYRTGGGNLRLANYAVNHAGMFSLQGDSGNQAGAVEEIAITTYDSNKVVTAVKTAEGTLKLIAWRINDDGSITRLEGEDDPTFNDPNAGAVSEIAIAAYDVSVPGIQDHVVTAVRTAEGNLRLIAWGIDGSNIVRLGDSGNMAGAATQIDVAWANNSQRIVTSMRDSDGNLRVIAWRAY